MHITFEHLRMSFSLLHKVLPRSLSFIHIQHSAGHESLVDMTSSGRPYYFAVQSCTAPVSWWRPFGEPVIYDIFTSFSNFRRLYFRISCQSGAETSLSASWNSTFIPPSSWFYAAAEREAFSSFWLADEMLRCAMIGAGAGAFQNFPPADEWRCLEWEGPSKSVADQAEKQVVASTRYPVNICDQQQPISGQHSASSKWSP